MKASAKPCPNCGGTGRLETAESLCRLRKSSRRTLKEVSKRMGIGVAYLCDLEHGRRAWRAELIVKYQKACKS